MNKSTFQSVLIVKKSFVILLTFVMTHIFKMIPKNILNMNDGKISEIRQAVGEAFFLNKVQPSLDVMRETLNKYPKGSVALSFNGGKDCTVLLELAELLGDKELKIVYFEEPDAFEDLIEFVQTRLSVSPFTSLKLSSDIRRGMEELVSQENVEAVFLGQRISDPYAPQQINSASSPGWPVFMRVCPILNWSYGDIWHFIVSTKTSFCHLYEKGYTSLGPKSRTRPNPYLDDKPAWLLENYQTERSGRF
ncbi:unnamed protein product [Blepharisma stoltei]|uniref:FAD synthase n=1 Tax=Blepharisma stoltei TaxID=1481888 RepID=A0AAU9K7R6_9CILI|nr:unnamed protein product [Blepharisma stoltei]